MLNDQGINRFHLKLGIDGMATLSPVCLRNSKNCRITMILFSTELLFPERESVRVMEESHLLIGIVIHTDWLAFNSYLRQFFHRLLHALHAERKVTQPTLRLFVE